MAKNVQLASALLTVALAIAEGSCDPQASDDPAEAPSFTLEYVRLRPTAETAKTNGHPVMIPERWCSIHDAGSWGVLFRHENGRPIPLCDGFREDFGLDCRTVNNEVQVKIPTINRKDRFTVCGPEGSWIESLELVQLDDRWCIRVLLNDEGERRCEKMFPMETESTVALLMNDELLTLAHSSGGCPRFLETHRSYDDAAQVIRSMSGAAKTIRVPELPHGREPAP